MVRARYILALGAMVSTGAILAGFWLIRPRAPEEGAPAFDPLLEAVDELAGREVDPTASKFPRLRPPPAARARPAEEMGEEGDEDYEEDYYDEQDDDGETYDEEDYDDEEEEPEEDYRTPHAPSVPAYPARTRPSFRPNQEAMKRILHQEY